jgi:hypothetical protein
MVSMPYLGDVKNPFFLETSAFDQIIDVYQTCFEYNTRKKTTMPLLKTWVPQCLRGFKIANAQILI